MIQVFGSKKSLDCKAAERFFKDKERRIAFQSIDIKEKPLSRGEFDSVVSSLTRSEGSCAKAIEKMADDKSKGYASFAYLDDSEKEEKLFENQLLLRLPVCRNGRTNSTVGLSQKTWK